VELVVEQPLFDGVLQVGQWAHAHPWRVIGRKVGLPMLIGTVQPSS
jgi:hypothetical protein